MDLAVKRLLLEQDGQAGGLKLYYDLVNKYSFHSTESSGVELINLIQGINHREVNRRTRGVDILMILVIL